jgi:hypothetical protein
VKNIRGITNSLQASFLGGCKVLTDKDLLKLKPEENEQDKEIKNVKILDEDRKIYFKATILVKEKGDLLDGCRDLAELSLVGSGDKRLFVRIEDTSEYAIDETIGTTDQPNNHEYVLDQVECDKLYKQVYSKQEFKEFVFGHAALKKATVWDIIVSAIAECFDFTGEVLQVKVQTQKPVVVAAHEEDGVNIEEYTIPGKEANLKGKLTDNNVSHVPKGLFLGLSIVFALSIVATMFILPPLGFVLLPAALMNLPFFLPIILAVAPIILSAVAMTKSGPAKAVSLYFVSAAVIMTLLAFGAPLIGVTLPFLALIIPSLTISLGTFGLYMLNKYKDSFANHPRISAVLKALCLVMMGTPLLFGLVRHVVIGFFKLVFGATSAFLALNITNSLFGERTLEKYGDMSNENAWYQNFRIGAYKFLIWVSRIVGYPIMMIVFGLISSPAGALTDDNPFQKIKFDPTSKWNVWMKFWYGVSKYIAANAVRILLVASVISVVVAASAVTGGLPAIIASLPFIKSIALFVSGIPFIGTTLTGWLVSLPVQLIFASTLGAYATAIIGFAAAIYLSYPLIRQIFTFINELGVFLVRKIASPIYRLLKNYDRSDMEMLRDEAKKLNFVQFGPYNRDKPTWENYRLDTTAATILSEQFIKLKIQAQKYGLLEGTTFEIFRRNEGILLNEIQVAEKIKGALKIKAIRDQTIRENLVNNSAQFERFIESIINNMGLVAENDRIEEIIKLRKELISKRVIADRTLAAWINFITMVEDPVVEKNMEWLRKKAYWQELRNEVINRNLLIDPENIEQFLADAPTVEALRNKIEFRKLRLEVVNGHIPILPDTIEEFLRNINTVVALREKIELRKLKLEAVREGLINQDGFANFILNANLNGNLTIEAIKTKIEKEKIVYKASLVELKARAKDAGVISVGFFNRDNKPTWNEFIRSPEGNLKTVDSIRIDIEMAEAENEELIALEVAAKDMYKAYKKLARNLGCLRTKVSEINKPTWGQLIFKYRNNHISEDALKNKLDNYNTFRQMRDEAVNIGMYTADVTVEDYIRGEHEDKTIEQLKEEMSIYRLRTQLVQAADIVVDDFDDYLLGKSYLSFKQEVALKRKANATRIAGVAQQSIETFIAGKTQQNLVQEIELLEHYNAQAAILEAPVNPNALEDARTAVLLKQRANLTGLGGVAGQSIAEFVADKTIEVLTLEVRLLELNKRVIDERVVIGDFATYSNGKTVVLIEQQISLKVRAQATRLLAAEQTLEQFVNGKEIPVLTEEVVRLELNRKVIDERVVIGDFATYSNGKTVAIIEQQINLKIRAQATGLAGEQTLEEFVNEKEIDDLKLEVRLLELHRDALTRGVVNNDTRTFNNFIRGIERRPEEIAAKIEEDADRLAEDGELEELNDRIN